MSKRGQVTIFIIVGILIVAIVAVVFIFRVDSPEKEQNVIKDYVPLYNYLQSCLEESLAYVIHINSLQGGYYVVDAPSIVYNDGDIYFDSPIPYYLINHELLAPSEEELKNQIAYGVKLNFADCFEFSVFEYNISYDLEKIKVGPEISNYGVVVEVDTSVYINNGDSFVKLKNITAEQDTNYLDYYNFAKQMVEKQRLEGDNLCLSCLVEDTESENYHLYLSPVTSTDDYILINTLNNNKDDLLFSFAYKFEK